MLIVAGVAKLQNFGTLCALKGASRKFSDRVSPGHPAEKQVGTQRAKLCAGSGVFPLMYAQGGTSGPLANSRKNRETAWAIFAGLLQTSISEKT